MSRLKLLILFTLNITPVGLFADKYIIFLEKQIERFRNETVELQQNLNSELDVYQLCISVGRKQEAEHALKAYKIFRGIDKFVPPCENKK